MKHLWEVFRRLQQAGLTINLPKSEFFAKELKFLLHTVKGSSRLPSTQLRYGTTPLLRLKKILGLLNFFTLSFLPQRNWSSHQRDSWRRRRCFVGRKNNMAGIGLSRQPSLACVATVKTGFCQWSYLASEQDLDSGHDPHQLASRMELNQPMFPSKGVEELNVAKFYKWVQPAREGYTYRPAIHRHMLPLSESSRVELAHTPWKEGNRPRTRSQSIV